MTPFMFPLGRINGAAAPAIERGTLVAQRVELLGRFADYDRLHEFKPGQLVAFKRGMTCVDAAYDDAALIYIRPLRENLLHDRALIRDAAENNSGFGHVDCLVAVISSRGKLAFTPADRRQLRLLTAAEQAEVDVVMAPDADGAAEAGGQADPMAGALVEQPA